MKYQIGWVFVCTEIESDFLISLDVEPVLRVERRHEETRHSRHGVEIGRVHERLVNCFTEGRRREGIELSSWCSRQARSSPHITSQTAVPWDKTRITGYLFLCSLMVRWVIGLILHGVDPLSYFSFQPVLHDWCNKGYMLSCLWDGAVNW